MALFMIGVITYGAANVFYIAIFPRLARNTLRARTLHNKYEAGEITREAYEIERSLEKNRISNISVVSYFSSWIVYPLRSSPPYNKAHSNIGFLAVLCLNLTLLIPLADDPRVNTYV